MNLIYISYECIFLPVLIVDTCLFNTIMTSCTIFAPVDDTKFADTGEPGLEYDIFQA